MRSLLPDCSFRSDIWLKCGDERANKFPPLRPLRSPINHQPTTINHPPSTIHKARLATRGRLPAFAKAAFLRLREFDAGAR